MSIILTLFIGLSGTPESCQLNGGTYKVIYDQKEYLKFKTKFLIEGERLTIIDSEGEREHEIEWIADDQFRLTPADEQIKQPTELKKQLNSLGNPFYKLSSCNADTIEFAHMQNLHITISSGKLVLME